MRQHLGAASVVLIVAAAGCSGAGSDATPTTTDPPEIADTPGSALVGGEADAEVPPSDSVADGGGSAREGVDGPAVSARFTAVSLGEGHSCGLRADATIVCWGDETSGQVDAPGGRFSGVVAGPDFSCGIRANGTRECWGRTGLLLVPDWPFANVDAGPRHWCGVRSEGTLACWGDNSHRQADGPEGRFTTVTAGGTIRALCAATARWRAGAPTDPDRPMHRRDSSPLSERDPPTRAAFAPTVPSNAGATTDWFRVRAAYRRDGSLPSQSRRGTPVGGASTERSAAGAWTTMA